MCARVCVYVAGSAQCSAPCARTPTTGPSLARCRAQLQFGFERECACTRRRPAPLSVHVHTDSAYNYIKIHTHTHAHHLPRVAHRGPQNRTARPPPKYVAGGTLHAAEQFTQKHRSGVVCVRVCGDTTSAARAERAPPSSSTRYSRNGRLASKQPNIVFVCVVVFSCCWFV